MRWAKPAFAVALLVVLQLLAAAALAHGQGWNASRSDELLAALLLAVQIALLYAVAAEIGGRIFALGAGLLFVIGPVVLAKRYFIVGGANVDYKLVYRHDVLPTAFGVTHRSSIVAACLLLCSAWLALDRTRLPASAAGALSGVAAAGAVLVLPHLWPALAAPVLAALVAQRGRQLAAAAAAALLGLVVLAVFRHVPHLAHGWHRMGLSLDGVREFAWSRRLLEYLPLAGLVGLCRRSGSAGAFFGTLLVATVILPLARPLGLTEYLLAIVPGLPVYFLLTASIPYLVPRRRPQVAAQSEPGRSVTLSP